MQIALDAAAAVRPDGRLSKARALKPFERLLRRIAAADVRAGFHSMSDHMLRDIGLTREQIDNELRATRGEAASRTRG